jgi:hypothetical protein
MFLSRHAKFAERIDGAKSGILPPNFLGGNFIKNLEDLQEFTVLEELFKGRFLGGNFWRVK